MKALEQATSGRTSIIIAHRLSTVTHCDQILVLSGGNVVESGTHMELLNKPDSLYKDLWESQNNPDDLQKHNPKSTKDAHDHEHGHGHGHHHHHEHGDDHDCGGCGHAHH